jgi:hypothetical protein
MTCPVLREGMQQTSDSNKTWSEAQDKCLTLRQTGRLTVGRDIRVTRILRTAGVALPLVLYRFCPLRHSLGVLYSIYSYCKRRTPPPHPRHLPPDRNLPGSTLGPLSLMAINKCKATEHFPPMH